MDYLNINYLIDSKKCNYIKVLKLYLCNKNYMYLFKKNENFI